MAERRMFSKSIVLSDAFLDMPATARCLYTTLVMVADDDGFINNPKSVMRQCGATNDDAALLVEKKFLISFDDGVVVIKHWKINNYIQNDRYIPTKYAEHKAKLKLDENKAYTLSETDCIQNVSNLDTECIQNGYKVDTECIHSVSKMDTQVRLGKDRLEIDKGREKNNIFIPPTPTDIKTYCEENGFHINVDKFINCFERQGWKLSNGNPMTDWKASVRYWAAEDRERGTKKFRTDATERDYTQGELRERVNDPLRDYMEARNDIRHSDGLRVGAT